MPDNMAVRVELEVDNVDDKVHLNLDILIGVNYYYTVYCWARYGEDADYVSKGICPTCKNYMMARDTDKYWEVECCNTKGISSKIYMFDEYGCQL